MIFYIVAILIFIYICIYQTLGRNQRVPQGLKEIPIEKEPSIIEDVCEIEKPLCNSLTKLCQKHGPIYRINIGMGDIVVLNNYEYIKAALVDNGHALSGRWKAQKYILVTNYSGLVFIDGNNRSQQRSFVMKTLKDFGMGRSRSIEIVQNECALMLENLEKLNGTNVDFANFIPIYTANVMMVFVMNKRFIHGDPDYEIIDNYMKVTNTRNDPVSNFLLLFPFLENNEWLMKFIMWITARKKPVDSCNHLSWKEIEGHLQNVDFDSSGDNLVDRFLIEQHQMKENNSKVELFKDWQLAINALESFTAGYDTTSSLLVWTFMFMGMYPEVQIKVHKEIIDKIGNERLPTMSDKVSLDYTQAVMDEIMRLSSIVPLYIFHRALNDINLNGFFIPKGTVVIPNILACHLDHNIWEKPFAFHPEHFLSITDDGVYKYKPREELILFGMRQKQYIEESLASMEYFIFYTSILQQFQVNLVDENVKFDVFDSNEGIIRTPHIHDFVFRKREEFREKIKDD